MTTLEETEPTARRVLGGAHPITRGIEECLRGARAALRAHEESVRLRDKAAAAQAVSDALCAEFEASRLSAICEAVEALTPGDT